ncbi:MAG TPA: class I SAM-dependent methyltransferase [Candidatus Sulfotelmatobacter sp.]|nr:class I SAM-dependent methyltransferase [Candidatus Sulfotelmatobacter sp.]
MSEAKAVAEHYSRPQLEDTILAAMKRAGLDTEKLTPTDLAAMDEFHVGGLEATKAFSEFMGLKGGMHVLDVGCGIGGPARYFAAEHGVRVTGIDLTDEFVRTANSLTKLVHLDGRAGFEQGSALAMPFEAGSFDAAYMFHVGMNIADKNALFQDVARVLKPGARFSIYDLMRISDEPISYPVPWAVSGQTSFVVHIEGYRKALAAVGFEVVHERGRREFGIDFFERNIARAAQGGPPIVGLQLLMGEKAPQMMQNVLGGMKSGIFEPVEMAAVKK